MVMRLIIITIRKGRTIPDKIISECICYGFRSQRFYDNFVENKKGDVLIAWENEAIQTVKNYPDKYEIITPSISILAQPSVSLVDDNVKVNGTKKIATEYLKYLYSDKAQKLAAEEGYRPSK